VSIVRAIGVISGTSMDGIDVALIESDGENVVTPGPAATFPYPPGVADELRGVVADPARAREPLHDLERAVTDAHVDAVLAFRKRFAIGEDSVALVGLHGQTILHRPREAFTRQLLDGAHAAQRLGVDVVSDFRSADVAAGGEGAPLAPLYHRAICAGLDHPVMVLNWGGVGNVTWLGRDGAIVAFDTGPANALLDDFVRRRLGLSHDAGGALANSGAVDHALVDAFMRDPWFDLPAPKSLDRNHFHAAAAGVEALSDADGAATLAAFTVEATAAALRHVPEPPRRWLVCGGGRRNATLMDRLTRRLMTPVEPIEAIGFDGDALEAQCFAWLAIRSRAGLPLSEPGTTGVPAPTTGGVFWSGKKKGPA
jgi:anhydro-N-acetylmuramic acid kinase